MGFPALLLDKNSEGFSVSLTTLDDARLPPGDVLIEVAYSTLNYKDGLAITDSGPVVRKWPMVPGVDGAGIVLESAHPRWQPGDAVVLNGWGVGEVHWGCLAGRARLNGDWLVALPKRLTACQAMAVGTAGYTAALAIIALQRFGFDKDQGELVITGATGGLGSIAIALATKLGYSVVAVTGKADEAEYLKKLGAVEVLDRAEFGSAGKPLQKERWGGAIDTAGSHTLANICAQMRRNGAVAACGLAQGMDLPTSVAPFILRGVALIGIDSVMADLARREAAWSLIADHLDLDLLEGLTTRIGLGDATRVAAEIMAGKIRGRYVVDVNA
jgi:acrylyl-CoA reductase (NADPH)